MPNDPAYETTNEVEFFDGVAGYPRAGAQPRYAPSDAPLLLAAPDHRVRGGVTLDEVGLQSGVVVIAQLLANVTFDNGATPAETNALTKLLPSADMIAAAQYRIRVSGSVDHPGTTAVTVQLRIRLDNTLIVQDVFTTPTTGGAKTNQGFWWEGILLFRSSGASGQVWASAPGLTKVAVGTNAQVNVDLPAGGAPVTIDTTADRTLKVSGQWNAQYVGATARFHTATFYKEH